VFLVPRFADRRIVDHASNKTNEFRAAAHAELSVKFEIVVLDEEQLRDEFGIASVYALPLEPPVEADRAGVAELAAATAKMENIDRKLGVAGIAEPEKTTLRAAFMDYAVRMQDFMDQLHADYEETWLTVSTVRTHRADRLRIDTALTSQAPDVFLGTTVREVADELTALPGLDRRKAEVLAYGFAGDWLLECPLDFRIAA
jgi:hypothetical protein